MHCQPATAAQCPVCKVDVTMPRVHSPSPTSRMLSFALPAMNWRALLSRQLGELREWVGQRRVEDGGGIRASEGKCLVARCQRRAQHGWFDWPRCLFVAGNKGPQS